MANATSEELQEVERQLSKAELALEHYRKAYALELAFSGPESPGGADYESGNRSGGAMLGDKSDPKKTKGGLATRRRKKALTGMRPRVAALRCGVLTR